MTPFITKSALLQALLVESGKASVLVKRISDWTDGKAIMHDGAVYPALASLVKEGCVRIEGDKEYVITNKGMRRAKIEKEIIMDVFGVERLPRL